MNKKIAIIGCGQLGSRHLQALMKLRFPVDIEVVEPSIESAKIAEERAYEIPQNNHIKSLSFFDKIDQLSESLDLVIIATGAAHRADIVRNLIAVKSVANLILEKIVFQKLSDFETIMPELEKKGIKCWMSSQRRTFSFYKEIKEELKGQHFSMSVEGGNWGLACNAIHFLDVFSFLVDSPSDIEIDTNGLFPKVYPSKREGYLEVNGSLAVQLDKSRLYLYSHDVDTPMTLAITSSELQIAFDEDRNWYRISRKEDDWKPEIKERQILYFNSDLTNIEAESIIENGTSAMPTLQDGYKTHKALLPAITNHINRYSDEEFDYCPIT